MTEEIRAIVIMLGLSWLRKPARKLDETTGQPKQWFFGVQVLQTWRGLIVGITARKFADTSRQAMRILPSRAQKISKFFQLG